MPNLLKYAFGMNLLGADTTRLAEGGDHGLPLIILQTEGTQGVFRYEFVRRTNTALHFAAQKSGDLSSASWEPLTAVPVVEPIDAEWERVIYEEPVDLLTTRKCFGHILIVMP